MSFGFKRIMLAVAALACGAAAAPTNTAEAAATGVSPFTATWSQTAMPLAGASTGTYSMSSGVCEMAGVPAGACAFNGNGVVNNIVCGTFVAAGVWVGPGGAGFNVNVQAVAGVAIVTAVNTTTSPPAGFTGVFVMVPNGITWFPNVCATSYTPVGAIVWF